MIGTGRLRSAFGALLLVGAGCAPLACSTGEPDRVVHVLGTWEDAEKDAFEAVVAPFEKDTGIDVRFQGTRDVAAVLAGRVEEGDPPEIAVLSSPGDLLHYAKTNKLASLDGVHPGYAPEWLAPGRVNGRQLAVVLKAALKSTIWFNPAKFARAGDPLPTTWAQLQATTAKLRAAGITPWCMGLASSTTSGWPGTDWIEDLVLARSGPDIYDAWASGQLSWRAPEIRAAWQAWGELPHTPDTVPGGSIGTLLTGFDKSAELLDPRGGCVFDHQGSFMSGNYAARTPPGARRGYDTFAFPGFGTPSPREVAGDVAAMFHATPAALELLNYLTGTKAQELWVRSGTALSPDRNVSPKAYGDEVTQALGAALAGAPTIRFDASDLMPTAMRSAFQRAVSAYVAAPADLDRILDDLDRVRATAY
ncbi:ABC transporter substrate-binding protein [Embleya scabrispora]|uniref:ABC transporter substrate-binding protein n=1 Tax=Embleya scabrispora TaxID=159449 RepID=UPI00036BC7F7|nr:ABC transporter substrate-binding protein [Embleya scabrispora]MYS87821.1 extracellular solute-binding protein [Streptomyces sp. SID5474]